MGNSQNADATKRAGVGRAVFLDRDGVLNREIGYVVDASGLEMVPDAGVAIARLNKAGYATVIVTNQSSVGRGLISESSLRDLHTQLIGDIGRAGGRIDAVYYCPHHPSEAQVEEYSVTCECRKPAPGMLIEAASDLDLNLDASFMVGDSERDIAAGKNAGCRTILINPAEGESYGADRVSASLNNAVDWILGNS